jgi:DNA end-binding protein Ku
LPEVTVNERELAVASTLVDALAEPFDPAKYHDHYREALLELIKNKTEGKAVVMPEVEAPGQVTDIMEALRASIEAARKRKGGGAQETSQREPAKRGSESGEHERPAAKARKSSRGRKKAA